nr:hypothetical protein [Gilliamella apicola]
MNISSSSITENQFKRTMKTRHLIMLSLGGVIGTGLFLTLATLLLPQMQLAQLSHI